MFGVRAAGGGGGGGGGGSAAGLLELLEDAPITAAAVEAILGAGGDVNVAPILPPLPLHLAHFGLLPLPLAASFFLSAAGLSRFTFLAPITSATADNGSATAEEAAAPEEDDFTLFLLAFLASASALRLFSLLFRSRTACFLMALSFVSPPINNCNMS